MLNPEQKCLKLQNFSTLMHIIAALENSNVRRLRRTWDLVNARTMLLFNSMAELMSPNKNSARYRDALKSVGPPCVPFLGASRFLYLEVHLSVL
jgi:son of sevenless-like protein